MFVYDNLTNPSIRMASSGCERIDVGKSRGRHTMEQGSYMSNSCGEKAREEIHRKTQGDPFVFGRCAGEKCLLFRRT